MKDERRETKDESDWDAVVVGAGPAGSVVAGLLAGRGWRVLLVERSAWPRDKACGGCLNAAAVGLLREAGLGEVLRGGAGLEGMALRVGGRCLWVPLPAGVAVERRELDGRLVEEAVRRGVTFLAGRVARLEGGGEGDGGAHRVLSLREAGGAGDSLAGGRGQSVRARVVLACDGLRGGLLAGEGWTRLVTQRPARLGFSATIEVNDALKRELRAGELSMLVGREGYVGVAPLGGGRVHVGAALWPEACNRGRGPGAVIAGILRECRVPEMGLEGVRFAGTGPLTARRDAVAGPRVLAIGDACGYVEPFTGEGLSWAIRGAVEAARLLPARAADWHEGLMGAWQEKFESSVRQRQRWCWRLRALLRRPRLAAGCVALAGVWPGVPARLARRISA